VAALSGVCSGSNRRGGGGGASGCARHCPLRSTPQCCCRDEGFPVLLDGLCLVDPRSSGVLAAVLHATCAETTAHIGMAAHPSGHTSAVVENTKWTRFVDSTQSIDQLAFGERVDLFLGEDLMEGLRPRGRYDIWLGFLKVFLMRSKFLPQLGDVEFVQLRLLAVAADILTTLSDVGELLVER
jgi:hypothetical protein